MAGAEEGVAEAGCCAAACKGSFERRIEARRGEVRREPRESDGGSGAGMTNGAGMSGAVALTLVAAARLPAGCLQEAVSAGLSSTRERVGGGPAAAVGRMAEVGMMLPALAIAALARMMGWRGRASSLR